MGPGAHREPYGPAYSIAPSPAALALADDGLRLAGIALAKADGFDEERVAALLAAAYGENVRPSAIVYVKRAVEKQREGHATIALTYLALAGLPPLADSAETAWRLSKADALMK